MIFAARRFIAEVKCHRNAYETRLSGIYKIIPALLSYFIYPPVLVAPLSKIYAWLSKSINDVTKQI